MVDFCCAKIARGARDSNYATRSYFYWHCRCVVSKPPTMKGVFLATFLSFTSFRCVQSFISVLPSLSYSLSKGARSGCCRSRMLVNRAVLLPEPLFSNISRPKRRLSSQRPEESLRATEEVCIRTSRSFSEIFLLHSFLSCQSIPDCLVEIKSNTRLA